MQKRFFSLIILIGIAIDMTIKHLGETYLKEPVSIIGDWVIFRLVYNDGIAFSLPIQWLTLQILTLVLIIAIIIYYSNTERRKKSRLLDTGYALLLSGAISHGYERIVTGYVIDFIAIKYFAVFNIADIFISTGIILILIYYYARTPK